MLSRALSLATVMLFIDCFTAGLAQAQNQNLEAGKSPSQIFAGTCTACHKSPRGLLKTVPPASLGTFLRQHYTTSPEMANVLSSYLVSNGATDTRYVGAQPKGGKDGGKDAPKDGANEAKLDARPSGPPEQLDRFGRRQRPSTANQDTSTSTPAAKPESEPVQAAKPDAEPQPQSEPPRSGRNARRHDAKRLARPAEGPSEEAARPAPRGEAPAQAAGERGRDGRKLSAKQKLSKRGRAGGEDAPKDSKDPFKEFFREPPKSDAAKDDATGDAPKGDTAKSESGKFDSGSSDSSKPDSVKSDGARSSGDGPSPSAKGSPKEDDTPAMRPDPVPAVVSAPSAATPSPSMPAAEATGSGSGVPPAVASAPPAAAPSGPPKPPTSQ
jgi:hypothetical protein